MEENSIGNKIVVNSNDLIRVKCDYCDSNESKIILKTKDYVFKKIAGEFAISKCLNCGLIFSNPRVKREALANYYKEIINYGERSFTNSDGKEMVDYYFVKDILSLYFNYPFSKKNKLRKIALFPSYLRIRKWYKKKYFIPTYCKNGKILEIGCSYGYYLYVWKKLGWEVKGIELNKDSVNFAVNQLNLDVENIEFEDFQSNQLYDVIYLNMVLEHVNSPKKTLHKCYSLLNENGILVLGLPDFSGIEVRIYKRYAYTLHLPYHLYHFTPNSIKKYLKLFEFKKIKITHDNFDRDLLAPLSFIIEENPDNRILKYVYKIVINKFIRKTLIKIIVKIISLLGKTSRMIVVATK